MLYTSTKHADGTYHQFGQLALSLYNCDLWHTEKKLLTIATVDGWKDLYSAMDVNHKDDANKFQENIGFPSTKGFLNMIDNCVIKNIPILRFDLQLALIYMGQTLTSLKEK